MPLVEEQIKLFKAFKSAGRSRSLSYQVDSFTRNNNYAGAEEAIRESRATGVSTHQRLSRRQPRSLRAAPDVREVKVPLQVRHSTRDPRLLAEISYAGGVDLI